MAGLCSPGPNSSYYLGRSARRCQFIYRDGDPEQPNAALKMRIYYRPDGITFLNTEASREPNPEGYNYSNIQGERQWTLFMPNSETSQCVLSRNGEVVDRGTVVRREPSSGD
jgi:hypothetical protein